ncbi:class I SAM-dependent methyltransferase [Salinicoccus bachuensis]|uniref:Class I SAM-dependent methyltransferase n=1 Tax=Salinicoccus bachuensis TaxID=3136731 RepID=A0ABZ3CF33_9STAP
MIVTTGGRTDQQTIMHARSLSEKYNFPYINRSKQSICKLKERYQQDIITVSRKGIAIHPLTQEEPLTFHPNMAMVRAKRMLNGETDPFIETAGIAPGMSVLDCTMGLAADSIIASLATGREGRVTALEADPLLHLLAAEVLQAFTTPNQKINEAMDRIETINAEHHEFLESQTDDSYDIIYFDPMFSEIIDNANAIRNIHHQTRQSGLRPETITEARRVARRRVVLKDHWKSPKFMELGFIQLKRKTSLFHYGYIDVQD